MSSNVAKTAVDHRRGSLRLIWIGTTLSVLLGAFLLFTPVADNDTGIIGTRPEQGPDLEIVDAVITRFRDSGELKYVLRSPRIEQYQSEDRTFLTEPDLEMHSAPDPLWRVTAERGSISNGPTGASGRREEAVLLNENVRMAQHFDDGREFELLTPSITIYPDREYAETDRDVMITTHAGRTSAVGLEGNLDQGQLRLFSNNEQRVHTILLPDQFK